MVSLSSIKLTQVDTYVNRAASRRRAVLRAGEGRLPHVMARAGVFGRGLAETPTCGLLLRGFGVMQQKQVIIGPLAAERPNCGLRLARASSSSS